MFQAIVAAAESEAAAAMPSFERFREIQVSSFSAGYGAVRALLRSATAQRIDRLMLLDGLHASHEKDGPATGALPEEQMSPFLEYARRAEEGQVQMTITHSSIVPPSYASTTETADWLLARLFIRRKFLTRSLMGMISTSEARSGRLRIIGFRGDSANDHIDHLHVLPELRCSTLEETDK